MPFVKTKRTYLRAATTANEDYPEIARNFLKQAQEVGSWTAGRKARNEELVSLASYPNAAELQTKQEIALTISAAENFRLAGEDYYQDSAQAYAIAAALYIEALKDPKMAAILFTEAANVMEKVDSDFAIENYRKSITQHCDASKYNEGAMLEEHMAKNHTKKGDVESAIDDYERATKLYQASNKLDSADRTMEKTAYLLGKTGQLRDAAYTYQRHAINQTQQNMKKFNTSPIMLRAGILLLADILQRQSEIDYSEMQEMMEEMYDLDCRFEESKEHEFVVDLMKCVTYGDLDKFADCSYAFGNMDAFDELMLEAFEHIKDKIVERADKKVKSDDNHRTEEK